MISLETARQLLDFAGRTETHAPRISQQRADDQLEGSVALHNILENHRVAYLADEVGLGKTYVALGAFALFRHFNPKFRLLVIAPKENIQRKWIKEMQNFVRNNVRFADLRVRSAHGAPARPPVYCGNLYELARETSLDPDRDFFARLTSFGFGLTEDSEGWKKKRERLLELLPWIQPDAFDLKSKQRFKENYARAIGCALPEFDLVIIDEGHNLKHGLQRTAAMRNRLLALVLGNGTAAAEDGARKRFPHYHPRARRVLFLSATPVEDDYRHIWNQLDVVGFGDFAPELREAAVPDDEKRRKLSEFLIRRVSSIRTGDRSLTKNLYRREWRGGGVTAYDSPLPLPGDQQRLIVALVQKKVSELLADERFNHSFQIGMLASFESFLQTAKVANDESSFDDAEQTDDELERRGLDVNAVNALARSYERRFRRPMPHPKMDALVMELRGAFDSGRKALVFVRRVASVKEIEQKLEAEYDDWLFARLRSELTAEVRPRIEKQFQRYHAERATRRADRTAPLRQEGEDTEIDETSEPVEDEGGLDTFFAWYFRGEGPPDVLSGAELAKRFLKPQFALSTFFEDNYVAELLGVRPGAVFDALCAQLLQSPAEVQCEIERRAGTLLRVDQKRRRHKHLFMAFQEAALRLLAEAPTTLRDQARMILHAVFDGGERGGNPVPLGNWLERATFFTAVRGHNSLYRELWIAPGEERLGAIERFRRRELRRELIASMLRLGHSSIDLYITVINQLGRLDRAGEGEDLDNATLAASLLDRLSHQREAGVFRAYQELREAASNFDLILDVNAHELWKKPASEVSREVGNLLRQQQPIGGMWGGVSKTLVAQFRMPGYPLVLVTTDLLQEGEDLHLFCSDVYHYGISWMPSSMEQRIGRIDRVRSQTERRLTTPDWKHDGDELLQVYFPYLSETVEIYQVHRVLERLNRFMRLMHTNLGAPDEAFDRRIHLVDEIQRSPASIAPPPPEPLESAFPVRRDLIKGRQQRLAVSHDDHENLVRRFASLKARLHEEHRVEWDSSGTHEAHIGSISIGERMQGFTLFLHSIHGRPNLRCVSPIGQLDPEARMDEIAREARIVPARICAVFDARFQQYQLTAEMDALLGELSTDVARTWWLIQTTATSADRLEAILIEKDQEVAQFRDSLEQEPHFER